MYFKISKRSNLATIYLSHFMAYDVISLPKIFRLGRQADPGAGKKLNLFHVSQSLHLIKHLERRKVGGAGIGTCILHSVLSFLSRKG